ncbi:MAG: hypothetical protein KDE47_05465 [Caldilineaceae bacterium]|nr:hypothetical protein [Anaerolineales bacterium]MCB0080353.1 hypothetical protein [Caldilineaceae bacterium]
MNSLHDLREEAQEAVEKVWFIQSLVESERTDITLSLRLMIYPTLFVQLFFGEKSGSLYMALIERGQRLFGIDREGGEWHMHPYKAVEKHVPLSEGLEPKPILTFLAHVERLLIDHELL